jgi:hypothetical protein
LAVVDANNAAFDYTAGAPAGYPARLSLWWTRSTTTDVKEYRVECNQDAAGYAAAAIVRPLPGQWSFSYFSDRLDDQSYYNWRVIPVDLAGNDGTPVVLTSVALGYQMVRTPDAPNFTITFDPDTRKMTFSDAA